MQRMSRSDRFHGLPYSYRKHEMLLAFVNWPLLQGLLWLIVLANLTVVSIYLLRVWRDQVNRVEAVGDPLEKFRELHRQGMLDDDEFRTIKSALDERLRSQDGRGSLGGRE